MIHTPSPPRKTRRDGWTAVRRAGFVAALGGSGSIAEAAAAVGMSRRSAYRLRARDAAVAAAWRKTAPLDETMIDAALDAGQARGMASLVRRFDDNGDGSGERALLRALARHFRTKRVFA